MKAIAGIFLVEMVKVVVGLMINNSNGGNNLVNNMPDPPRWRMVTHSHIPESNFEPLNSLTEQHFWSAVMPTFTCNENIMTRVGHADETGKMICGLINLANYSFKPSPSVTKCLLYSFINEGDLSYEAEVLETTHCEVYIYDEHVNGVTPPIHSNNPRVHFERLMLDETYDANDTTGAQPGTQHDRYTIKGLMNDNGHTFIDILRLDIEGREFAAMDQLFLDFDELPVGQMLVQAHIWEWTEENVGKLTEILERIEKKGFRLFSISKNVYNKECCRDLSFINMHSTDLFLGPGMVLPPAQDNKLH